MAKKSNYDEKLVNLHKKVPHSGMVQGTKIGGARQHKGQMKGTFETFFSSLSENNWGCT